MIKAEIAIERIFTTFVPGAIFLIGGWYLHRPFLLKYFPNLAGDPSEKAIGLSTEYKIVIFFVLSFCVGLAFNQLADVCIALLCRDDAVNEKSLRRTRRIFRRLWSVIAITARNDPRTGAIRRYLRSPRKDQFLRMMRDWAGTSEELLQTSDEQIFAHQHIVVHLRAYSDSSRRLLEQAQMHVLFSSSMLMGFAFLLLIAILALFTSEVVDEHVRVHFYWTLGAAIVFIYLAMVVISYVLKRHFKQFCNYVLTIALHFHQMTNDRHSKPEVDGDQSPMGA